MTTIPAHSRPTAFLKIDGRTREARLIRTIRASLTAHVGGNPSATQTMLIERACALSLRLALLDTRMAEGRDLTDHDSRTYLAWSNSLSRIMAALGMNGAATKPQTLADAMRQAAA